MKFLLPIITIFTFLLTPSTTHSSYFIQTHQTQSTYKCIQQTGINHVVLLWITYIGEKGYQDKKWLMHEQRQQSNNDFVDNVLNAKNAGLDVELLYILCRSKTPEEQISATLKALGGKLVDKLWVIPSTSTYKTDKCVWNNYSPKSNCLYLQQLITTGQKYNVTIGAALSEEVWLATFQEQLACPQAGASSPLWWLPGDDDDGQPNFDGYRKIGGWKMPQMKALNEKKVCGVTVLENYFVSDFWSQRM